jgi:glutathionylspermidine synthase
MLRIATPPRLDWTNIVESQGLLFHSIDGMPYWDETAFEPP